MIRLLRRPAVWLTIVLTASCTVLYVQGGSWPGLRDLEAQSLNIRFRLRGPVAPHQPIALVVVDDRSIEELGRWPIARRHYADAIRRLRADGATLIALDILFTDPEPPLLSAVAETVRRAAVEIEESDPELSARLTLLTDEAVPDRLLAAAMAKAGNVVVPFAFVFGDEPASRAMTEDARHAAFRRALVPPGAREVTPLSPTGVHLPQPQIGRAAAAMGHVTTAFDTDGAPRYAYPALGFDGAVYPSLAVQVARMAMGLDVDAAEIVFGSGLRLGGHEMPTDGRMRLPVNYYGPAGTFPTHSFADLVAGRLEPGLFAGRIVIVGGNALGLRDTVLSPFSPVLPGVERHATILDNILSDRYLRHPDWIRAVDVAAIVLGGLLAALTAARLPAAAAVAGVAGLLGAWWLAAFAAFATLGWWLAVVVPSLSVAVNGLVGGAYRWILEAGHRRRAERALRDSEERYALAAEGANDGLWDWDLAVGRMYYSPRWREMIGDREGLVTDRPEDWFDRVHAADLPGLQAALDAHLADETSTFEHEYRIHHGDGQPRWMLARGLAVRDRSGRPTRIAGSQTDVTERRLTEQQMAYDALHDRLTGLPNRLLLRDRLEQALGRRGSGGERRCVVLHIDLDRFKAINDGLGRARGDALLVAVADRLVQVVGPGDTVARLFGDEFAVMSTDPSVVGDPMELADRISEALSEPHDMEGEGIVLEACVGIAVLEDETETAEELMRKADIAVYVAKQGGRRRAERFTAVMREQAVSRLGLEADLRRAVSAATGFELRYQPIVSLTDRRITGFEALVRWHHDERGMVSPEEFIPLAEDTGVIIELGNWILETACGQAAIWQAQGFASHVAVNISARQFASDTLVSAIARALASIRLDPALLKVEVTESAVMDNPRRAAALLRRISDLGVRISIDDFGTGYSSLAYLNQFPFHTLKLDRTFVERLTDRAESREIVRVVSALASGLDREMVAEGVETEEQLRVLVELGVPYGQGYLFAPPLIVDAAATALRTGRLPGADQPRGAGGTTRKATDGA